MKKIYLLSAMAAGLLAFASCSNDDIAATTGNGNNELGFGESELTIGITNTATRAARPIGSSAAANNVNKVTLKLFKTTDYSEATGVSIKDDGDLTIDWAAGPTGEGPSTTDREGKKTITLTGLQANTTYQIVAYGYNGTEPTVTNTSGTCSISSASVEEVFAGQIETVTTNADGKFPTAQSITMERQIAGMLGYFTAVPTHIGTDVVAKLVVYANAKTTGYNFDWESSSLNGLGQTTAKTALLTFDMSKIGDDEYMEENAGRLMTVKGVTLPQANGKRTFAPEKEATSGNAVNRSVNNSTKLVVRTSTYADFAGTVMPEGKLDITGVFTRYRDTWQILMRQEGDFKQAE